MGLYLVERYVPSLGPEQVAVAVDRLRMLDASEVSHLWTVLIPSEDTANGRRHGGHDSARPADSTPHLGRARRYVDRHVDKPDPRPVNGKLHDHLDPAGLSAGRLDHRRSVASCAGAPAFTVALPALAAGNRAALFVYGTDAEHLAGVVVPFDA